MKYDIPGILNRFNDITYFPYIAGAVNKLLQTTNEIDYQESLKKVTEEVSKYKDIKIYDSDEAKMSGVFNLPIYHPMTLKSKKMEIYLDSAVIEISRQKNIVSTALQGRDGTVKEYISNGDYSISVQGVLSVIGQKYPITQLKEFMDMMNANESIDVVHAILNELGIMEIVISEIKLPRPVMNIQQYSFSALSNESLEF